VDDPSERANGEPQASGPGEARATLSARSKPTWEEWVALKRFADENRSRFPAEQLAPYLGQVVAWLPDSSAIRAAAKDFGTLWDRIQAEGDDPSQYTYEDIPIL
jgi:hypothetical protein